MPKKVPWEQLGDPLPLDARHDLARVPSLLTGFTKLCVRHILLEHGLYTENRCQSQSAQGAWVGAFRCASHVGCFKNRKSCTEFQATLANQHITFFKRSDRSCQGEWRKVEGLSVEQLNVFEKNTLANDEAAVMESRKS